MKDSENSMARGHPKWRPMGKDTTKLYRQKNSVKKMEMEGHTCTLQKPEKIINCI